MGLLVFLWIVVAMFSENAIYGTAFTHQQMMRYSGFVSVVMRSRWLKGSGMDDVDGKRKRDREREGERKRDAEGGCLKYMEKRGWQMEETRSHLHIVCRMLRVYRTELSTAVPPAVAFTARSPHPLRQSSTPPIADSLAWLCSTPGTRLTHKLTLCPLFVPVNPEILRNADRARESRCN